ncbi:MAG: rhodanese-like domain-containing protein [Methylotenera sp.]|nr:rhodanese-like domain-containing protein [Methylotenera sp.]
MEFIKNNALLIGLAIGSGLMLLIPMFKKSMGGVPNLTPNEAVTLINRSNALVLDVRDEAEFATGHIADAMHIPIADLEARLGELKKYKTKPVLVNCQRGVRGGKACEVLRKAEFTQVNNLQGGLNAWVAAKLPIVASSDIKASLITPAAKASKKAGNKSTAPAVAANDDTAQDTEKS